jgi:polysaccharide pyruvyl transferase WcaK-like protein
VKQAEQEFSMNMPAVSIDKSPAAEYPGILADEGARDAGGAGSFASLAKAGVKRLLPQVLLDHLHDRKEQARLRRFYTQWDRIRLRPAVARFSGPIGRLLIFPSDPSAIIGAVGDDAMISATVSQFKAQNPSLRVDVLCRAGEGERAVRELGFAPVLLPDSTDFVAEMDVLLRKGGYEALVILGADVLDGYYNAEYSRKLIAAADLAARAGLQSLVLGFSFNEEAAPELADCFARLAPEVAVNVRDEISLARLTRFAPVAARLVADSAFTLQPGEVDPGVAAWIAARRAEGRRIIGVNLHPMLIRAASAEQIDGLVRVAADAIMAANRTAPIAWLLVPHDYRDASGDGDSICLRPLHGRLEAVAGLECLYVEGRHRAAALKALAGQLDGVITGRMHLAIASLGMGVPTLCLSYQSKFEGLYRHFDLPHDFLLPPSAFQSEGALRQALEHFLATLPGLTAKVAGERDKVLALARDNFAPLRAGGAA